jgi:hypothetical protein
MTRPHFGTDARRTRLAIRHRLAPSSQAADVVAATTDMVGLHATDPTGVYLAARARTRDFTIEDLDRALYEDRTLVRMLGQRRTLFVVPIDLVPVLHAAAARDIGARERPRLIAMLEAAGIEGDAEVRARWLAEVEAATVSALEARGEAVATELAADVPGLRVRIPFGAGRQWQGEMGVSTRVLFLLSMEGRIARGRPRGTWISSQYRWVPVARWLPAATVRAMHELATVDAQARLIERWLARFGPGTMDDLRWWTGFTVREIRAALATIRPVDVDLGDGATGYALADDLETEPPMDGHWVAFLPALDPTIMGWRDRGWYLGSYQPVLFDRNGNAGPTIWLDGRVVGGWTQRRDGSLSYRLLEDVGAAIAGLVEAEADRLRTWFGPHRIVPRFPTPLMQELGDP